MVSECVPSCLWPAGWGLLGKRDRHSPPWQLLRCRLGWRDMLLLQVALAGPAGDLNNALLRRCLSLFGVLCCRLCLTFAEKTSCGKKWPDTHCLPQGLLARRERHRRSCSLARCALLPSWCDTGGPVEDHLACVAQRARRPSRCHTDRLPGLLLSAGLMAHQIPLPGLVCPSAQLAQS